MHGIYININFKKLLYLGSNYIYITYIISTDIMIIHNMLCGGGDTQLATFVSLCSSASYFRLLFISCHITFTTRRNMQKLN
jgi:hypothetical protein